LDLEANLADVIEKINRGKEQGANLIVFPELALTGYFVGQDFHQVALRLDSPEIRKLVETSGGTAVVVGFIEESPSLNFYNSALVAIDGRLQFAFRKLNLPNYGLFEERKLFSSGKHVPVFQYMGFTIAVFICSDLWHPSLPYLGICQKANVFLSIINSTDNAMGKRFSNIDSWSIINAFYSRVFGVYNISANRAGQESFSAGISQPDARRNPKPDQCETILTKETLFRFWGGSEILNPYGEIMAKAALYQPDEIHGEIDREVLRQKRIMLPYLQNDNPFFTHRELGRILYGPQTSPHPLDQEDES
jgi:predicted amidohydrolase